MKRMSCLICLVYMFTNVMHIYAEEYSNTHENTGDLKSDIVAVAETQLGYCELTDDGNPAIDSKVPYYTKYGAKYGNPNGHWCAFFVLWCADEADIPTSIICKSATCGSCREFVHWFKDNNRWRGLDYIPQGGDIIFFDWENDGLADHVGIVKEIRNDFVVTIEGNTGGENGYMVMEQERCENILGYGVPDYELIEKINGYAKITLPAYMLPDKNSEQVWEVWAGDELQILCRDGDYYLVQYPYVYTGRFVAAYIPTSAVELNGNVPSAEEYYNINKSATISNETIVYHNASTDDLMSGSNNNKVRKTLNTGNDVNVLFADGDFIFIKTDKISGYIPADSVVYNENETMGGDLNDDKKVDSADAGIILRYDAGMITLSPTQLLISDINIDGKVNSADAGIILRYDSGILDKLK